MPRQSVQLGQVQETLLVPLFARAIDSRRKRPMIQDAKAVEMVESIDWNFQRFNQRRRMEGCVLRTAMYDDWARDFIRRHPEGTVVEIGAGLNTRFERLDNGAVHWFDLDLPDTVALRRKFFADSERRATLGQVAANFPGAGLAFDTVPRWAIDHGNRDHARLRFDARFVWACEDHPFRSRLSFPSRTAVGVTGRLFPKLAKACLLNLFTGTPPAEQ